MTVDAFAPAPVYTISGTGPYAVPHEYLSDTELVVSVRVEGADVTLNRSTQWSAAPAVNAPEGVLTLTAEAAAIHAGRELRITRATAVEQGWVSQGGAQETGLEKQLDRIVQALQDGERGREAIRLLIQACLRVPELGYVLPTLPAAGVRAGRLMKWNGDGSAVEAYAGELALSVGPEAAVYDNNLAVTAASIPAAVTAFRTANYAVAGDRGGASWVRVASAPSHAGRLQSADGAHWELAGPYATPEQFGADRTGAAEASAAFQALIVWAETTGGEARGRPDATYRIDETVEITASGVRLVGHGAKVTTAIADGVVIDGIGTSAARLTGLHVDDWHVTFSEDYSHFVRVRGMEDIYCGHVTTVGGGQFCTELTLDSDGYDGAPWDGPGFTRADISQLSEDDLCKRLTVENCWGSGAIYGPANGRRYSFAYIMLAFVIGAHVTNCHLKDGTTGIGWIGGDANPANDGGVDSVRWVRDLSVTGCSGVDHYSGACWGSQGRDVRVTNTYAIRCRDIGMHAEGGLNCIFDGNVAVDCRNGGFTAFFECVNELYSNNTVIVENASSVVNGGVVTMMKWNNATEAASENLGGSVAFVDNDLLCLDASEGLGRVVLQNGDLVDFIGNRLVNTAIGTDISGNGGTRRIENNRMRFTATGGETAPVYAIRIENIAITATDAKPYLVIRGNVIEAAAVGLPAGSAGVYVQAIADSLHMIEDNKCFGLALFCLTESLSTTGAHRYFIQNNLTDGIVHVDVTDGVGLGNNVAAVYRSGNRAATPAMPHVYSSPNFPTRGLFARSSEEKWNVNDTATHTGFVALNSNAQQVRAATSGTWSDASVAYTLHQHVTGSDGAVHVCIKAHTSSAARNPVGGAERAEHWRKVAPAAAIFKAVGQMAA